MDSFRRSGLFWLRTTWKGNLQLFCSQSKRNLKIGKSSLNRKDFPSILGFQELDEDIQEVRAENAFICFSQALKSDKSNVHDEAAARLMMLLIRYQKHLKKKVEQSCRKRGGLSF